MSEQVQVEPHGMPEYPLYFEEHEPVLAMPKARKSIQKKKRSLRSRRRSHVLGILYPIGAAPKRICSTDPNVRRLDYWQLSRILDYQAVLEVKLQSPIPMPLGSAGAQPFVGNHLYGRGVEDLYSQPLNESAMRVCAKAIPARYQIRGSAILTENSMH